MRSALNARGAARRVSAVNNPYRIENQPLDSGSPLRSARNDELIRCSLEIVLANIERAGVSVCTVVTQDVIWREVQVDEDCLPVLLIPLLDKNQFHL